jgi:flagella basal body P-ring formation protein FlgA
MSLDYISERLRKKGFLTVRPKLRNRKDHVVLTPFIATSQSTPHATARLHQEDTLKPDVESLSASENTKSAQHYYCALKMALPRGTLLEPNMVELTLEKRFIEDAFISPEDLIGYRLERSLSKGSILSKRHVTIPPAIEKGATVKIVMRSPGIEITGIAKTLGQGKVGDTIEVRRNRETLQGTIVDPHTVLIQ